MNKQKKQAWIKKGYALVAEHGFEHLSINVICRAMDKSKSSLYHYFGDLEGFKEALMQYHLELAHGFAAEIRACQTAYPDLINVLMQHKVNIFFYKHFRIHRDSALHQRYNPQIFGLYEAAVLDKWAAHFDLKNKMLLVEKFNKFLSEHFLMSISFDHYTEDWIVAYLAEIGALVQQMKQ